MLGPMRWEHKEGEKVDRWFLSRTGDPFLSPQPVASNAVFRASGYLCCVSDVDPIHAGHGVPILTNRMPPLGNTLDFLLPLLCLL